MSDPPDGAAAALLVARRALDPLADDVAAAADAAARLAAAHRDSAMAGRSLLGRAAPLTFGRRAADWMQALDEARARLDELRGDEPEPDAAPRRIGELTGALGGCAGVIGRTAREIALMAQPEIAELREGPAAAAPALPTEPTPVAALAALASSGAAPGLAAALLATLIDRRDAERTPDWRPFRELLAAVGSAAAWLRACLERLAVDVPRMRANLLAHPAAGAHDPAQALLDAAAAVDAALAARRRRER